MAPVTWSGAGSNGDWETSANWSTTPGALDILYFAGTTRLTNTNNYASDTQFAGFTFNSGAGAFTLAGNAVGLLGNIVNNSTNAETITLGIILAGGSQVINTGSGNVVISGTISQSGTTSTLVETGGNTLTLSGPNTFSGGLTLNAGTLMAGNNGALGTGTLNLCGGTFGATAELTIANNINVTGTNIIGQSTR